MLILCQTARRAVELCKIISPICKAGKQGQIGKFFGKHKQVKEQLHFLETASFVYAVGTAARTAQLCETGKLKFGALTAVVLDASWVNGLGRSMLEDNEARRELCLFLGSHLFKHAKAKGTKITFF